jgi:hypothetical protein
MNQCPLIKSRLCRYWYRSRSGPVWPHEGRQRLHPEAREDHKVVPQLDCCCEWTLHTFVSFSLPALLLLISDNPPTPRHFLARTVVLIAYRLWTRQSTMRDSRKAFGLTKEAAIMAESGAIYSITLILIIATYASKSNSFNVFLDMVSSELYLSQC